LIRHDALLLLICSTCLQHTQGPATAHVLLTLRNDASTLEARTGMVHDSICHCANAAQRLPKTPITWCFEK